MKKLYIILIFLLLQNPAFCQTAPYTIEHNTGKCCGGNDLGMGSSFKVFGAGQINSVTLYHRSNQTANGTLYIYKGNGPDPDSLLYQQNVSVSTDWNTNSQLAVTLNNPVPVKKDSMYTVYLVGIPLRYESGFSTYTDGTLWTAAGEDVTGDLDFQISIGVLTVTGSLKNSLAENTKVILSNDGKNLHVQGAGKDIELKLFTTGGNLVGESKGENLSLPELGGGVYILQITKERDVFSKKIVITQ
jgi:hypothetical protein